MPNFCRTTTGKVATVHFESAPLRRCAAKIGNQFSLVTSEMSTLTGRLRECIFHGESW